MAIKSTHSFWELYLEARASMLPSNTDIYSKFQKFHREYRIRHLKAWSKYHDHVLPKEAIIFYNRLFSEVDQVAQKILKGKEISSASRKRAKDFYGVRLKSNSTLKELLATDIFGEKTIHQDINVEDALTGDFDLSPHVLLSRKTNVYHYFLHRPQQSQFLFLHELIVGYMGNAILNNSKVPCRSELELLSGEYWKVPAYITDYMSEQLNFSLAQTVELHFLSNDEVKAKLPEFFQELMMVSSHLYWYLDRYASQSRAVRLPVTLLSLISHFYTLPLLEQYSKNKKLRLTKNASKAIDKLFFEKLLKVKPQSKLYPGDYDIATTLQVLQKETFKS